ncbi:hypothetical protein GOBAR_AA13785 [Gossypium barbadense]|uniref:Delta(24)-sterol reductase n=1 Tax=Gossypium barbadense TaxID=3634 RepID=A0A2P5XU35_GOSBA|nr:hypothetical protein GOBAR_AA13785 [Gossypium barbadense]
MRNVDYKRARHFQVDLAFRNILEIDKVQMIARVEPIVTKGQSITVPMNLSLAVVADLDYLTIFGLINGNGIAGNSHIYGLFSYTVVAYEKVLAVALLELQTMMNILISSMLPLELAKGYMDSFTPKDCDEDQDNVAKVPEFVEAIIYSPTKVVFMTGRYASKEETKKKGNNIKSRFLLGWLMPPKVSLLKVGEAIRNYYHEMHVIQDMLVPLYKVYPIWLCPRQLFKVPIKTMVYPEPGFKHHCRQDDTPYARMFTYMGPVLRGEVFDGAEAVSKMEQWLIKNHSFQQHYAVSELNEKDFWRMFDVDLYEYARKKYGAVGTFMSGYYKSKKGRETEGSARS